jgi:dTDP-3-amino-3,4,6-trideoxy-alpha-D-glucose transaminase
VVPVVDLSRRTRAWSDRYGELVRSILDSGQVLLGPHLAEFESAFAAATATSHCIGVSSGASALQLALTALDVGPGDEVIVPAFTAVPTAAAVCAVGAVPIPVDVGRGTATIDPDAARAALGPNTAAVISVHLYGRPAAALSVGRPVIDDAAQAHGALSAPTGVMSAYSFYPTKNLGGIGDGGAIVTDNVDIASRLRRLRVHGMTEQYLHTEISQNFRMSELEAAWLALTLPDLAAGTARRRAIAAHYRDAAPSLQWQDDDPRHVYHLCVLRAPEREVFRTRLARRGVDTAVHYPRALTQQPAYETFRREGCPEAEQWAAQCVSVPVFPELTDAEVELVAAALAAES